MTWRHDPITDLDLMAYADGQLDAARRQTVEAHLAATPDDAAMVDAIIAQNADLRLALAGIAEEPVPERLKAVLEREPGPWLRPAVKAASLVGAIVVSGLGGWWFAQDRGPDTTPPAFLAALPATGGAVVETNGPSAAIVEEAVETAAPWAADQLSLMLSTPSLGAGFSKPVAQQLVEIDGRPTVRFTMTEPDGRRLSLFLQTRRAAEPPAVWLVDDPSVHPGPGAYWQDGPLVWAMTGDLQGADLADLARQIATAIELEPGLVPIDAEMTRLEAPDGDIQLSAEEALPRPALLPLDALPIELAGG
jgi:anti-sigma factor RsiW